MTCNSLFAYRKFGAPTTSRWRAHPQQRARYRFWTLVYHATSQGHSAVQTNRCPRRSTIGCHLVALLISGLLQIGELAHAARPQQLTQPSYLAPALCVVFGHRAILIFLGIEMWLGALSRTYRPYVYRP